MLLFNRNWPSHAQSTSMPVRPESRDTVPASSPPEAHPGSVLRETSYRYDSPPWRIATLNIGNGLDVGVSLRTHRRLVGNLWRIRWTVPLTAT